MNLANIKTPGVYIKEKNNLPSSVAGVSTAVPAFIGITEKNPDKKAHYIKSLFEYQQKFGGACHPNFKFDVDGNPVPDKRFYLYDSLSLYFTNGGGPCYILSAETYENIDSTTIQGHLTAAIAVAGEVDEATLLLMPDMHFQYENPNGTNTERTSLI